MHTMARMRVALGRLEIEFEGTEEFLRNDLPNMIETFMCLAQPQQDDVANAASNLVGGSTTVDGANSNGNLPNLSVASICARLDAKTGSDVILAAAAYLGIISNMNSFSQDELRNSAKSAAGYWKEGFASNFRSYIKTLIRSKKLNQVGTQSYSLPASIRSEIESKLAD